VQVALSTESSVPNLFGVSACNSTGALVTTSQIQYPAGTLQLPSGTYTFTAMASQTTNYYAASNAVGAASSPSGVGVAQAGASTTALCCVYSPPVIEYGYVVQEVSGPLCPTIPTKGINTTSTTSVMIRASFPNGSAAKGASVSASVLGNWYWGYSSKSTISMCDTTDSDGVATLVTPSVPLLVSVWASLPVNLPVNKTIVQRTVTGENINVTVYWQPTYVSFGAWSLITPRRAMPHSCSTTSSPNTTLPHIIQEEQWPKGVAAQTASSAVYPNFGPGGIAAPSSGSFPGAQATQTQDVTNDIATVTTTSSGPSSNTTSNPLFYAGIGFGAALVASIMVIAVNSWRPRRSR
jgi:hypothetical protein